MMRLIAILIMCGLISAVPAHAAINKCTGADGKVSYTDKPCPTQTKLESSELTPEEKRKIELEKKAQQERAESGAIQKELDEYRENKRAAKIARLKSLLEKGEITQLEYITIQQKGIFIGMSQLALELSWGKPSTINRAGVGSDQWVYSLGAAKSNYAYVDGRKVTNWQVSE